MSFRIPPGQPSEKEAAARLNFNPAATATAAAGSGKGGAAGAGRPTSATEIAFVRTADVMKRMLISVQVAYKAVPFKQLQSTAFTILQMFNPEITLETIGFAPIGEIVNLSMRILLIKPAVDRPDLALTAFPEYLEKRDLVRFWKTCGVTAENVKKWGFYYNLIEKLSAQEMESDAPLMQIANPSFRVAFETAFKLFKDTANLLFPIFEKFNKNAEKIIAECERERKNLADGKKADKSSQTRLNDYRHAQHFHEVLIQKLTQMKRYTGEVNARFMVLKDKIDPNNLQKTMEPMTVVFKHLESVVLLSEELLKELACNEAHFCLSFGIFPVSKLADEYLRGYFNRHQQYQFRLYDMIYRELNVILETHEITLESKPLKKHELFEWLTMFCERLEFINRFPANSKLAATESTDYESVMKASIDRHVYQFRKTVYDETLELTKSETGANDAAKAKTEEIKRKILVIIGNYNARLPLKVPQNAKGSLKIFRHALHEIAMHYYERFNNPDEYSNFIKLQRENDDFSGGNRKKAVEAFSEKAQQEAEKFADLSKEVLVVRGASKTLSQTYYTIVGVMRLTKEAQEKEQSIKADQYVEMLLLEEIENERLAQEQMEKQRLAAEALKKLEKTPEPAEQGSAGAAVASPMVIAKTVLIPDQTRTYYTNPAAQFLFQVRCELAQLYGKDPVEMPDASSLAGASVTELAVDHTLYAYDGLCETLEMLSNAPEKEFLVQQVLKWGYRVVEQAATAAYPGGYSQKDLNHNLAVLLRGVKVRIKNLWTTHANSYTVWQRYPAYYSSHEADLPFGLTQIKSRNEEAAKMFTEDLLWVEDLVTLQNEILLQTHKNSPQQVHISNLLQAFRKRSLTKQTEVVAKDVSEAHSKEDANLFCEIEQDLDAALTIIRKHLEIPVPVVTAAAAAGAPVQPPVANSAFLKALENACFHLINLQKAIGSIKRSPKQRSMHIIIDAMLASIKEFTESLGVVFSIQKNRPLYTHSISAYQKLGYGENLSADMKKVLNEIDIKRADEFLYRTLSRLAPKDIPPNVKLLHDHYRRSKEAVLMGEGAIPSAVVVKSVADLQANLREQAKLFAKLAHELAKSVFPAK
jgi:hypothetical protein